MQEEMCSSDFEWIEGQFSLIGVLQGGENQPDEGRLGACVEEPSFLLSEDYHLEFDLEGTADPAIVKAEPLGWLALEEGQCSPRSDSRSTMQTASVSSNKRISKKSPQKSQKSKSGKEHSSIESIICFREQKPDLKNEAQESKRRLTRRYLKNKQARNHAVAETPDFEYLEIGLESPEWRASAQGNN